MKTTVSQLIVNVKAHKEEAKFCRDEGNYDDAVVELTQAIELIDSYDWEDSMAEDKQAIAWHLADCLGMLGGNLRRLNRLEEAAEAFERGGKYESAMQLNTSYNLVNVIAVRIESGARGMTEQRPELTRAVTALERQVRGERRMDRWAWADLGQCRLLSGDLPGADEAYSRFLELGDAEAVKSAVAVLGRLRDSLKQEDNAIGLLLDKGIELLTGTGHHHSA